MTTASILRAARALIDTPEKWCKGSFYKPTGEKCLTGALSAACPASEHSRSLCAGWDAVRALLDATGAKRLESWNDAPERTHKDVMDAFQRALDCAALKGDE